MTEFEKFKKVLLKSNFEDVKNNFSEEYIDKIINAEYWTPIIAASNNGQLETAKFLIEHNCNIEWQDNNKFKPIHYASFNGYFDIAKLLIEKNCEIECLNYNKNKPIHLACLNGHVEIVKLLIEKNCEIECENEQKNRSLHLACINNHLDVTKLLIEQNCVIECENIDKNKPIHLACINGHHRIVDFLICNNCDIECENNDKNKPIQLSCFKGHLDVLELLIEKHSNIECENINNEKLIHLACNNGYYKIVRFLVDNNCNIECENNNKSTPLTVACMLGFVDISKYLIDHNCNIESENSEKCQPIHLASKNNHLDVVKLLIEHNCNIECENAELDRPIHLACYYGHIEIIKYLLLSNCNLQCQNKNGKTPLDVANNFSSKNRVTVIKEMIDARKEIFQSIKNNDEITFDKVYHYRILPMLENEDGISVIKMAVLNNAENIINYILNKPIDNSERSYWINSNIQGQSDATTKLIHECLFYRSIKYSHLEAFDYLCNANIINMNRLIVKLSFLEIAVQCNNCALISRIMYKTIYNKQEWENAKLIGKRNDNKRIIEVISIREDLLQARQRANFNILQTSICDGDVDMMKYILEKNLVDYNINNDIFRDALALAHSLYEEKSIEMLEKYMIDRNTYNQSK